jgi:hypothetical protein
MRFRASGVAYRPHATPVKESAAPFLDALRDGVSECARFFGAVAQLGERMTGSHEVEGSIPFSSTIPA